MSDTTLPMRPVQSYIIPTRDRPSELAATLRAIGALDREAHERAGGAEVIVIDNASRQRPTPPRTLANGLPVRLVELDENIGAAARNVGAQEARGEWLVMLDDDSEPLDCGHLGLLHSAPPDVAAIGAEIVLPSGAHEAGGLPEVFIGCGVIIRRDAFLGAGGYDPAFHYYAEEYDLAARLLREGWRIEHDGRFRVLHRKAGAGRDMNLIVSRLVRNNSWIALRYAPDHLLGRALAETASRYERIARREGARAGYRRGLAELRETADEQRRTPLPDHLYDRFTGLAHARGGVAGFAGNASRLALVDEGKNAWAVRRACEEIGARFVEEADDPAMLVVGTLSPGPVLDALRRRAASATPVVAPWRPRHVRSSVEEAA